MSESYCKTCLFVKRQCNIIKSEERKKFCNMTSHFNN